MKQELLRGFGASYLTGQRVPDDMPDEVVTQCSAEPNPEAVAIRLCIKFAKRRFGYRQIDIAKLCGWKRDNHLSSYASGALFMPVKHFDRFAQVTGCNLLNQVQRRVIQNNKLTGNECANKREEAALDLMLATDCSTERRAA